MLINIDGRRVDVLERACRWRTCLRVGRYTHRTAAGASGCSARTDENLSCLTRDERGCPQDFFSRRKLTLEEAHSEGDNPDMPRFAWTVRKPSDRMIRCMCGCDRLFPRWMVYDWERRREE